MHSAHRQELKSINLFGVKIHQTSDDSFIGNLKIIFGYKSPHAKTTLDKAQPNITRTPNATLPVMHHS